MELNVKYQRTDALSLWHRQERKEISALKVKAKMFSLMDNQNLYRFARFLHLHLKHFLGKDPKSLLPLPKHKRISFTA